MNLTEIFDTKYEVKWTPTSWGEEGGVSINETPFIIQFIKNIHLRDIFPKENLWEVKFFRADKDDTRYDVQHDSDAAFAVYGVVFNSILGKKSQFNGLYFTSVRSEDTELDYAKRTRIYWGIAKKLERYARMFMYVRELPEQTEWLFVHKPLEKWGEGWKSPRQQIEHVVFSGKIIR